MNGFGNLFYEDGRKYVGEFQNDLKHGHGIYSWPNGKKYEGNWKEGK